MAQRRTAFGCIPQIVQSKKLTVILATTVKAGGSKYLSPSTHPVTGMEYHVSGISDKGSII